MEINIAGSIKEIIIFDDPEYCYQEGHTYQFEGKKYRCPYYFGEECELFRDNDGGMQTLRKLNGRHIKLQECASAWSKEKL